MWTLVVILGVVVIGSILWLAYLVSKLMILERKMHAYETVMRVLSEQERNIEAINNNFSVLENKLVE